MFPAFFMIVFFKQDETGISALEPNTTDIFISLDLVQDKKCLFLEILQARQKACIQGEICHLHDCVFSNQMS